MGETPRYFRSIKKTGESALVHSRVWQSHLLVNASEELYFGQHFPTSIKKGIHRVQARCRCTIQAMARKWCSSVHFSRQFHAVPIGLIHSVLLNGPSWCLSVKQRNLTVLNRKKKNEHKEHTTSNRKRYFSVYFSGVCEVPPTTTSPTPFDHPVVPCSQESTTKANKKWEGYASRNSPSLFREGKIWVYYTIVCKTLKQNIGSRDLKNNIHIISAGRRRNAPT